MRKKIIPAQRPTPPVTTIKYSTSKTIPGQSLLPSDLLKRHLAGTLPDIDHSKKYEYHFDENGNRLSQPLPLEMHEVHKLAVVLRKRQHEEQLKQREKNAEAFRNKIIDEFKAEQAKHELAAQQKTEPVKVPKKLPPAAKP